MPFLLVPSEAPCAGATSVFPFACGHAAAPSFWLLCMWVSSGLLEPLLSVFWGDMRGSRAGGHMETPCNSVS